MHAQGNKPLQRSDPAAGPFVEERAATQQLLGSRPRQDGHDVFLVRDVAANELVLIHSLAVDPAASPEARDAVLAAARKAEAFRHPSVLAVRSVEGSERNLIFVQPFPGGVLLGDYLAKNGPVAPPAALHMIRAFAEALLHAQTMGLTLSQVSPHDFIARPASTGGTALVMTGLCPPVPQGWWLEVADPAFASPEQKRGLPCDVRSSIYSAGAVLAHMLTGGQPHAGQTWGEWMERQSFAPSLKAALLAALQENPHQRASGPGAWLQMLEQADKTAPPVPAPSVSPPAPPRPELRVRPSAHVEHSGPERAARPRWRDALALGSAVGLGFLVMRQARQAADHAMSAHPGTPEASTVPLNPRAAVQTSPPTVVAEAVPEPQPPAPPVVSAGPASAPAEKDPPAPTVSSQPPPAGQTEPMLATVLPPAKQDGPPRTVMPPTATQEDSVAIRRAQAATPEEELLYAARQARPPRQAWLYREVLSQDPNNREALHSVVEDALASFPADESRLSDLRRWTAALEKARDPLGGYARGRLLLEDARKSPNLRAASTALTQAVDHLDQVADRGYSRAWFLLLQGLVNLHNVQQQAGNARQAAQTSRTLFAKIEALPRDVAVEDLRLLAERLQQLVADRAATGRPHPQAAFLRRVIERLQHVVTMRNSTLSQRP